MSHVPYSVWYVAALLVVWLVARPVIALVFGKQIGEKVLAKQKPNIHLVSASPSAAKRPDAIETIAQKLRPEGFSDAGWFTIPEMPDIVLRLFAHEAEGWLAIVYEHARAERPWLEVNCRFPDETRLSFTDQPSQGLASLPGCESHHVPGASPEAMLRAARTARAKRDVTPLTVSASTAPRVFEDGYAKLVALRQSQGITRREVVAVAMRKPIVKPNKVA